MEGRLQMLRALHCWCEPAPLPDASYPWLTAPSAFPLHCPGQRRVHKGNRQPLGEYGRGKKVKIPPGSTPAVHFTMYMTSGRSREVRKAAQMVDVTISKTPWSLLWCLIPKRWAAVPLWCWRAHYCLLFRQWWVGLTALLSFSVHIFMSLM